MGVTAKLRYPGHQESTGGEGRNGQGQPNKSEPTALLVLCTQQQHVGDGGSEAEVPAHIPAGPDTLMETTGWTGASCCPHPLIPPSVVRTQSSTAPTCLLGKKERREAPLERKETAQIVSLNFEHKE